MQSERSHHKREEKRNYWTFIYSPGLLFISRSRPGVGMAFDNRQCLGLSLSATMYYKFGI